MHKDKKKKKDTDETLGAWDSLLTNLRRMSSSGHILGSYSFFYTIYFLLIPFTITRSILFGFLQCRLQSFNSFSCSSKSLLQFRKFTAKICIVTYQLQNQNYFLGISLQQNTLPHLSRQSSRATAYFLPKT